MPCPYIYESQAARRRAQTPGARRSLANVLRGRELSRSSRSGRLRLLDLHVHGNEVLNKRDLEAQPFVEHCLLNASELAEDHAALAGADRLNNTGFQFEPGIQPLRWSSASLNRELVARVEASDASKRVVLDMDSIESPVYGQQEGSAYNGHFESLCYHPLLLFSGQRRLSSSEAASGQHAQRRGLGRVAAVGDRAPTGRGQTDRLPGRSGFC